jgi:hypothetical protein
LGRIRHGEIQCLNNVHDGILWESNINPSSEDGIPAGWTRGKISGGADAKFGLVYVQVGTTKDDTMLKSDVSARAKIYGPELLLALERLLSFPQNQESTDLKLMAAITKAQRLVYKVRGR